jgi:hypothetical protein
MTESPSTAPRWHRRALFVAAGALGAGTVAGGLALASAGHQPPLSAAVRLAAATTGGASGADQAAAHYVDIHYPGAGTARVLKTEPDVERGVPVYDVRILAPDGTTYVVHVRQAGDAVLSANPAEHQASALPATVTTDPPATSTRAGSPPARSATASTPVAAPLAPSTAATAGPQPTEPVETPEAPTTTAPGVSSPDQSPDQSTTATGGPSPDHPKSETSRNDN